MSLRYNPKKPSILQKDPPKRQRSTKEVEKLQPISHSARLGKWEASFFSFENTATYSDLFVLTLCLYQRNTIQTQ